MARVYSIVAFFVAILALNSPEGGSAFGQDYFRKDREDWSYFESCRLETAFRGATSFDLNVEPGSGKQRRAQVVLHFAGSSGNETAVKEVRQYDARVVQLDDKTYRIEGLPSSLIGATETLTFNPPPSKDWRTSGPLVLRSGEGHEIRTFRMYPFRVEPSQINSPDPIPARKR